MLASHAQDLNSALVTPRLLLEPLLATHADVLFAPLQDERIYEWISARPPADVDQLRRIWSRNESRLSPDTSEAWLNWAVRRAIDGVYIGKLDAAVDANNVATNFGYIYFPEFWGQGYATECTRSVMEHFSRHGILEVYAFVTQGNAASEGALTRAGFIKGRILPDNDRIRGCPHDDVEYLYRATSPA